MSVVPKSEGILSAFLSFILHYTLKQNPSKSRAFQAEIAAPNFKTTTTFFINSPFSISLLETFKECVNKLLESVTTVSNFKQVDDLATILKKIGI